MKQLIKPTCKIIVMDGIIRCDVKIDKCPKNKLKTFFNTKCLKEVF